MKKMMLNFVLDYAFEEIMKVLDKKARRTGSKVDDKMVKTLRAEKKLIIKEVKESL